MEPQEAYHARIALELDDQCNGDPDTHLTKEQRHSLLEVLWRNQSFNNISAKNSQSRTWYYYPIEIPLNAYEDGPVTISEAIRIVYEVWDQEFVSHGTFDSLLDAIELNSKI